MGIPNHYSASLSETDMDIVRSVPEGGNWKDVPLNIPCKRIETIRRMAITICPILINSIVIF